MARTRPVLGNCEAKIIPLRERSMRPCGAEARDEVDGRKLCARHARVARDRKLAEAERQHQSTTSGRAAPR
jgi:hypothetical protein